ncbi:MAG TPA: PQQ-binding-like beta-propeller repeat protein [Terriglobales bacterium]|nr:PQQ-binding-like beta-propeller repeat protein [Terriglobales bacterium]
MKASFRPARLLVAASAAVVAGLAVASPAGEPAAARPAPEVALVGAGHAAVSKQRPRPTPTPAPTPTPSPTPSPTPTPSPPPPDSATAFQGGPTHTGVTSGDSLQPAIARGWTRDLGSSVSYPLIAQGLIFVTTGHTDQTGLGTSSPAQLVALSQATGQTVWGPVPVGDGGTWANAAYDGGRVFTVDRAGVMRAFDAASGTPAWTTTLPDASLGYEAAPTALNGRVYTDGGNNEVVAVNEGDGTVAWTTAGQGGGHFSDPAVTPDGVFVCFGGGDCYKFDPATGTRLWVHSTGFSGGGGVAPIVAGGRVWGPAAPAGQAAPVLDAATGAQVGTWPGTANPAIDVAAGIAIFSTSTGIEGIDLTSGAVLWSFAEDGPVGTPEIANGFVYISTAARTLYVLDERTGRQVQYDYTFATLLGGAGGQGSLSDPWGGLGIGQGLLGVPAGNQLWIYSSSGSPPPPPPTFTPIPNQPDQATAIGIDPAHSGDQTQEQLAPPLKTAWTVSLNGSVAYPLIANGMVFALVGEPFTGVGQVAGARLYGFDLASGRQLWGPIETGGRDNNGGLAYDQGRVFVVNGSGWLKAFDSRSGVKLWAVQLLPSQIYSSPPVALNGTVYVNVDQNSGGAPAVIEAIDGATGAVEWTQNVSGGSMSPAATASDVFSAKCAQVVDFPAAGGAQRWAVGSTNTCSGGPMPVVSQGRVYNRGATDSGGNAVTIAYDATSGAQLGSFPVSPAPPAFDGAGRGFFLVRIFGTGPPPALEAHDVATGNLLWSFGGDGQLGSNPVTANGFVYVASMSGTLYVLDAATGTQVWSGSMGSSILPTQDANAGEPEAALAVGQGAVVVPTASGLTVLTKAA